MNRRIPKQSARPSDRGRAMRRRRSAGRWSLCRRAASSAIVSARAPQRRGVTMGNVELTHPDRELWPGITKQDLAEYWQAVADHALPGLARRPLAVVRCPEGIGGEHFFQKHGHGTLRLAVRQGEADGQPYLAIDDADGLIAMAQISAIELHAWGATEADPLHPDRIVFDLDPGDGVAFADVVKAALDVRDQSAAAGTDVVLPHHRRQGSACRRAAGAGRALGCGEAVLPRVRRDAEPGAAGSVSVHGEEGGSRRAGS